MAGILLLLKDVTKLVYTWSSSACEWLSVIRILHCPAETAFGAVVEPAWCQKRDNHDVVASRLPRVGAQQQSINPINEPSGHPGDARCSGAKSLYEQTAPNVSKGERHAALTPMRSVILACPLKRPAPATTDFRRRCPDESCMGQLRWGQC